MTQLHPAPRLFQAAHIPAAHLGPTSPDEESLFGAFTSGVTQWNLVGGIVTPLKKIRVRQLG